MKQREIKFRAWDKNENSKAGMQSVSEIDFVSRQAHLGDKEYGWWRTFEDCELMQFTGLYDKNGKEIYEGDLFACIYKFDGHKDHIYEVYYDEMHGRFGLQRHGNPCSQYEVIKELIDVARYPKLGNIYENPELLK